MAAVVRLMVDHHAQDGTARLLRAVDVDFFEQVLVRELFGRFRDLIGVTRILIGDQCRVGRLCQTLQGRQPEAEQVREITERGRHVPTDPAE